ELKAALWGSRLGKAVKASRAFVAIAKGLEKVGVAAGKVGKVVKEAEVVVKATRVFRALEAARKWVTEALLLGAETVKNLSLEAINRLATLSEDALEKLRALSE